MDYIIEFNRGDTDHTGQPCYTATIYDHAGDYISQYDYFDTERTADDAAVSLLSNVGTVIHGTMRPQDLIAAMLDNLATIATGERFGFDHKHASAAQEAFLDCVPAWVQDDGDACDWWDSDEAAELVCALGSTLDECSPEGFRFGAHVGDGSDFGYWSDTDE